MCSKRPGCALGKHTTLSKPTERKNYYEVKAKDAVRHLQELGNKRKLEDPLEKERATHSIILAWKIPWTGEVQSQT